MLLSRPPQRRISHACRYATPLRDGAFSANIRIVILRENVVPPRRHAQRAFCCASYCASVGCQPRRQRARRYNSGRRL